MFLSSRGRAALHTDPASADRPLRVRPTHRAPWLRRRRPMSRRAARGGALCRCATSAVRCSVMHRDRALRLRASPRTRPSASTRRAAAVRRPGPVPTRPRVPRARGGQFVPLPARPPPSPSLRTTRPSRLQAIQRRVHLADVERPHSGRRRFELDLQLVTVARAVGQQRQQTLAYGHIWSIPILRKVARRSPRSRGRAIRARPTSRRTSSPGRRCTRP